MVRGLLVTLVLCAGSAQAAAPFRCDEVRWRSHEGLASYLEKEADDGWVLVSFPKPSRACFEQRGGQASHLRYSCVRYAWRDEADLSGFINERAAEGLHLVAFAKPASICFASMGKALPSPTGEEPPRRKSTHDHAPSNVEPAPKPQAPASDLPKPPPAAKAKPKSQPKSQPAPAPKTPEEGVRERADKLHQQLEALERAHREGEIDEAEYERRKKELEQ